MQTSLVSIILPTFKRSEFIRRAIDSVREQTYSNWELIIVDDNDGDNEHRAATIKVLEPYLADPRVIYVKHERNKGLASARNTGIKSCRGEFIAFIDDDDIWYNTKLEKQVREFARKEVGLVYSYWERIDSVTGNTRLVKPELEGYIFPKLGLNHIGPPSLVMCRAIAVASINGFDTNLKYREDIDFYYRIAENFEVALIREPLIKYYVHPTGMSRNYPLQLQYFDAFLIKHGDNLRKHKDVWLEMLERKGELQVLTHHKSAGMASLFKSFIGQPTRINRLAKMFLALFGNKFYRRVRGNV